MPETCRVSWQNKILDTWFILLVIYTRIITMHGHLNIKYKKYRFSSLLLTSTVLTNKSTQLSLCSIHVFKNSTLQHVSNLTGPSSGSTLHYCIKQMLNNIWPSAYAEELMGIFRVRRIGTAGRIVTHQIGAAYGCTGRIYGIKKYF